MLATTTAPAYAELVEVRATSPSRSWEPAPRRLELAIASTPQFLAESIGVSGLASFRSSTRVPQLTITKGSDASRLCLGAKCTFPTAGDGIAPGMRLVAGFGRVGTTALALFTGPIPKKTRALAMGLAPMFACGGGGLEMRLAWW